MGTDIHLVVQVRRDGAWHFVDIPKEERYGNILDHRWYDLFSILGNVRNGYGFAGVTTGSGFVPISDQRGLPKDFPGTARTASGSAITRTPGSPCASSSTTTGTRRWSRRACSSRTTPARSTTTPTWSG